MTSSDDPDRIRRDIERTQAHLSSDVNALTEKVTPSRIVGRRVDRAKAAGRRLTDRVMGSDDPTPAYSRGGYRATYDPYDPYTGYGGGQTGQSRHGVADTARAASANVSDAASSAASTLSETASSAAAAVQDAPRAVRRQTRGNPLAAGLVAFGAGWLVSSLLPASRQEQRVSQQAADLGRPVAEAAKHAAAEVKDNLQEPAQQAAESVKYTAGHAGRAVVEEGRAAADDAQTATRASAGTVHQSPPPPAQPAADVPPSGRV